MVTLQHPNIDLFMDWWVNFLSFDCMASHYGVDVRKLKRQIRKGRILRECHFGPITSLVKKS